MIPSIITLQREQMKKNVVKSNLYKIVLKRCGQRIVDANKKTRNTYCFFEIPTILIGHSDYNVIDCAKYLISELVKEGYIVEFIQPNYLYIDWGNPVNQSDLLNVPTWVKNKNRLKQQAEEYIKRYPDAKVEIVYDKKFK